MIYAFWSTAALLVAGALLFVLPPLWRPPTRVQAGPAPIGIYREQRAQLDAELAQGTLDAAQHAHALDELQARVIDEVADGAEASAAIGAGPRPMAAVLAVALLLPAGALALYGLLGKPAVLAPVSAQAPASESAPHAMTREQMEAMVESLADKLKKSPDDANGWHMLARSYVAFNRMPEAAQAYDRASKLAPKDPQILADYADTLAMVNGRNLEGPPMDLINAALKIDPAHPKSLSLAATAAFNRGEFTQAATLWQKLQALLPPDSEQARAIASNIAQAQSAGGKAPAPAAAGPAIEGSVSLAPALKARVPAGAVLFIFARAVEGARMPLAILRVPAGTLPYRFKLDDSLAMTPQTKLSGQSQVALVARISRSGGATPQSGDLMGTLTPVKVGAQGVELVIGEVVP